MMSQSFRRTMLCHPPGARSRPVPSVTARRGVLSVWTALALLLCGLCTALVINHLWISSVRADAVRCAEAAALAAGQQLLSDEVLLAGQPAFRSDGWLARSREAALAISQQYCRTTAVPPLQPGDLDYAAALSIPAAAGHPPGGTSATAGPQPALTQPAPVQLPQRVSVAWTDARAQSGISLFLSGLTGRQSACLGVQAAAQLENCPLGFRPATQTTIPLMPFCLVDDPTGADPLSWHRLIEGERGDDHYAWVAERGAFESGPDGLPEITLTLSAGEPSVTCQSLLPLQLCREPLQPHGLPQQIRSGISHADLTSLGLTELRFPQPVTTPQVPPAMLNSLADELAAAVGRACIWCIHERQADTHATPGTAAEAPAEQALPEPGSLTVQRPVAARIVRVRMRTAQAVQVTLQPCVLVTGTAIMDAQQVACSRYIYSVRLIQ